MRGNYIISIDGMQYFDLKNKEETHFVVMGAYKQKNDKTYIHYSEYEDDDNFAAKKLTTSMLKIESDGKVTFAKKGGVNSKMILEKGKRHYCYFETEVGALVLGIFTYSIDSDLAEHGGTLKIRYSLDINSVLESVNEININVKECQNNVATAS